MVEPDWWARGIGIAGVLLALAALGWNIYNQLWREMRPRVSVIAFAGRVLPPPDGAQAGLYATVGEFAVKATSVGSHPITVCRLGLLNPKDGTPCFEFSLPEPMLLEKEEGRTVRASVGQIYESIKKGLKLVPYCEDIEGRIYKGKVDKDFYKGVLRAKNGERQS